MPEVRCIGADGHQFGVIPTHEALRVAEEAGLDLVEVSPKAAPPVCKIMDYGKFKYEESRKKKAARKNASVIMIKEVKLRPKTDDHDIDTKVRQIRGFLQEGNKAKMVVIFRGREIVHPETGQAILQRVVQQLVDVATVEQIPTMEGRRMTMIIGPKAGLRRDGAPPPATVAPAPVRPSGPSVGPARPPGAGPVVGPARPAGPPPAAGPGRR